MIVRGVIMKKYLFVHIVLLSFLLACKNTKPQIAHTESDNRVLQQYLEAPVIRPNLELANILDTEYDLQLMKADEWGIHFDIVRLDFECAKAEIVMQDTLKPIRAKYVFKQKTGVYAYTKSIDSLIKELALWDIQDTLNKNRLIDGGDFSIILKKHDRIKLIRWQDILKNETTDKQKARSFYQQVWQHTHALMKE